MSNEYQANLAEELALENVATECATCGGIGIKIVSDQFGEHQEECECIQKFFAQF